MKINHNIQALNAYRNLAQNMNNTSKSLEKLSSGMRINRAADDAAGLAISEKMRSQIRGLDMAERNTLDAISLIQTGEGALNQTHEILQRMRELSIQAANGTLEEQDRTAVQNEIDQLTFEIDRIADTTQFNQKKLLSGSEKGNAFAYINSDQVNYAGNGTWNGVVTALPSEPASVELQFSENIGGLLDSTTPSQIEGKTFIINNKKYEVVTSGAPSAITSNGNIAVKVNWAAPNNDAAKVTNVNNLMNSIKTAVELNDSTFKDPISGSINSNITNAVDSTGGVEGTPFTGTLTLASSQNMSVADGQKITMNFSGFNAIKAVSPETGVTVTNLVGKDTSSSSNSTQLTFGGVPAANDAVPYAGDELKVDGLTIRFSNQPQPAYVDGNIAIIDVKDKNLFEVVDSIQNVLTKAQSIVDGSVKALNSVDSIANTLILSTNKTDDGLTNGLDIQLKDMNFEANKNKDLDLDMQIGANSSEVLKLSLGVMDAAKLGLARSADGAYLGTGINAEKGIDVSTTEAARSAITRIDEAIRMVSEERSKLGAIQNRLEHTTVNLQTANENLTSAESRIRDTDMAKEMTAFTKNNILNQAGQAMLAQANQLPQGILQLLK
ncbi:flagellin [Bacillus sp. es.034]|uniref:flagellin N-terminal helical domain-containing protein n=1 Tax=Bacillus sp. es.034 TaxID=1761763 RepID=UPI000BF2616C|nr:flagellin [Bacillus sp. es.034]PFG04660.1 flagellin [Bacillus sp. es.034]